MKAAFIFLLCFLSFNAIAQNKSYDYCYTRGTSIQVYSVADKKAYPILDSKEAWDPSISPDGEKVAYTISSRNGDRNIGVIDLSTKKKTVLKTGSKNCYGPAWSPDGKYLAYSVIDPATSNWRIAFIDADNGSPKIISGKIDDCSSPTWQPDGKHITAQNLDNVYVFDLSGDLTATYKVDNLAKTNGATSSDRFVFTSGNTKIIFSASVDEPGFDDGPPTAAFAYDIAKKSSIRLTPKGYYADRLFVKGNTVLFTGGKITAKKPNVYSVDLDGKNLKVLFSGCRDISAKL